jgi:hypothetical protein
VNTKANDPADWGETWRDPREDPNGTAQINPNHPTDARDTIQPRYESIAPTSTIGEYFAAGKHVQDDDPTLPPDYNSYLSQRTAWPREKLQSMFSDDTPLDAKGNPVG